MAKSNSNFEEDAAEEWSASEDLEVELEALTSFLSSSEIEVSQVLSHSFCQ
jgi:hypothetical protein